MACLLASAACNPVTLDQTELVREGEITRMFCSPPRDKVDVLVVVDDSPSMAAEQERLVQLGEYMTHLLEREDVRLAVTTTSVANGLCPAGDGGKLVYSSCRERLDDFVVPASIEGEAADVRAACTDHCGIFEIPASEHPWFDSSLGEALGPTLACALPQGVAGCAFESPLEALKLAIEAHADRFFRPDAVTQILLVTDEYDCSIAPEGISAFDPAGTRALWTDPDLATSGICWGAGVQCTGGPGIFDDCRPWDAGILHPVARYTGVLDGFRKLKEDADPRPAAEVLVSLVAGVPQGYENGSEELVYRASQDPAEHAAFGVASGCELDGNAGYPPVRLRAVLDPAPNRARAAASVCGEYYASGLSGLAHCLADRSRPWCLEPRVDPQTCVVGFSDGAWLPQCEGDPTDRRLPPGADGCFSVEEQHAAVFECTQGGAPQLVLIGVAPGQCLEVTCAVAGL